MRIFNRIQCILLCLMMLCAMCPVTLAAETEADMLSATYTYSPAEEQYTVYGAIQSNMGNTPILLTINAPDGNFFTGFETTAEVTDNGTVYSFSPFNIPDNGASGRYTLTVSVEFLSKKKELYIDHYSVDDKFSLLQEVNSAILTNGDIHGLLTPKATYLALSQEELQGITQEKAIQNFNNHFKSAYQLPQSLSDENDSDLVIQAWKALCTDALDATIFSAFVDIDSKMAADKWMDTYYATFGFDKEDPETACSETKINEFLKQVRSFDSFTAHLMSATSIQSLDELREYIYESILLSSIQSLHSSNTYTIFTNFPAYFAVDTSAFSSIPPQNRGSLYTSVANQYYANYKGAIDAFNSAVAAMLANDTGGGKQTTVGTGSRGDSIYYSDVTAGGAVAESEGFSDMNQAEWARKAVEHLTELGIISGRSEKEFAPQDNVTRAEFAKMVVLAKKLAYSQNNTVFADVAPADWHSAYVLAAYNAGYIYGNENNEFMPNQNISRQDMATILQRAFSVESSAANISFSDFGAVAEYAKEAVSALSAKGLINGMGDGTFAPHAFATRAQAAQMIYNLLTTIS